MQKRNYVQRTVAEFEAAKPFGIEFLSMSLSKNCVKYVKGYRIVNGKPGTLLILWDSKGRAFVRYMSKKNALVRLHNAIILYHEGWTYIRESKFDLFPRNIHGKHTQS